MEPPRTPVRWSRLSRAVVVLASLGALVFPSAPAQAAAGDRADIVIDFNGGWPTNAKNAFRYAANRWETMIYSPVPIEIDANWNPLGPGHLGSASPGGAYTHALLPRDDTFYPAALANALIGSDIDPSQPDIDAQFNEELTNWYFGTDGNGPAGDFDLATVAMHELGHGLGFGGFMNYNEITDEGYWTSPDNPDSPPGIYDRFTTNRNDRKLLTYPHGSTALGNQLTSNAVYWTGARATAYNGAEEPRMYAPSDWASGTSYGHVNETTYPPSDRDALMTPFGSVGEVIHNPGPIVLGIFQDMGWQLGSEGRATVGRTTILKATVADPSISLGQNATLSATLTRATNGAPLDGKTVRVYRRPTGSSSWTSGPTRTTNANGRVTYNHMPSVDYQYQFRYLGTGTTDPDTSNTVKVEVT